MMQGGLGSRHPVSSLVVKKCRNRSTNVADIALKAHICRMANPCGEFILSRGLRPLDTEYVCRTFPVVTLPLAFRRNLTSALT